MRNATLRIHPCNCLCIITEGAEYFTEIGSSNTLIIRHFYISIFPLAKPRSYGGEASTYIWDNMVADGPVSTTILGFPEVRIFYRQK